jgi:glycerol-3-phosphate dehydrogenase
MPAAPAQIQPPPIPSCDVLIVGGGINGAGIARDLALRAHLKNTPLRIVLAEKNYWSAGTSGKNSHLIHGGLRYLKYFDFGLVHEALRERATLLKLSPDSVRPLRFEIPLNSLPERLFYSAGVALYDLLSLGHRIGNSNYFRGPLSYWDAASDSAPLVIDNMRDARHYGAICVPRTTVRDLTSTTANLYPLPQALGGAKPANNPASNSCPAPSLIQAKVVVDTRGPWANTANLRLVRGSHIVVPRLYEGTHAIAHFHKDGRILFFIPWGEPGTDLPQTTLIGTTDVDHTGTPDDVRISNEEVQYIASITAELFPKNTPTKILGTFSSLRPLVVAEGKSATATSREHKIEFNPQGILAVTGGKYTTYRSMSEEATDLICTKIAPNLANFHPTRTEPFAVETKRPKSLQARYEWAKQQEGCDSLEAFLTCSTNWAWQKHWTPTDLIQLGATESEAQTLSQKWAPPPWPTTP